MKSRTGIVVFVVIILVSSLSFALPGAGAIDDTALENVERGESWERTGGSEWIPAESRSSEPTAGDSSPPLTRLESLHRAGVDGEGVTVGVIGNQFDASQRSLGESVVEHQRFANKGPIQSSADTMLGQNTHDTAVAETVARTAPESALYLADVGRETTPERYAEAVDWLLEKDVDVVVDAASYFPANADGMGQLNDVASDATEQGVVFVTSAGNYANRHWAGTASGDGWVEFAPETPYNDLGDGKLAGHSSLRLYWEGDADFDLYLYRATTGEDTLVAKSASNQFGAGPHSEAIDTTLPSGNYYVAVRGSGVPNGTALELFAAKHAFAETSEEGGMVAPATAESVIAVGAVDSVSGEPQPYSSSGPKLDISAPEVARTTAAGELRGSSAAAPLVAGTVALMVSENASLTPARAQQLLQQTATRMNGQLYLDTAGAVKAVSDDELTPLTGPLRATYGDETYTVGDGFEPVPTSVALEERHSDTEIVEEKTNRTPQVAPDGSTREPMLWTGDSD
ncbi:MAG: S8 family serine peptidase [Halolamina sp.]